jgi:poly(3-hydroxyalkanoate) synthetase
MGQEIHQEHFSEKDMAEFHKRLREETKILKSWFDKDIFSKKPPMTGIELEAWLVDNDMLPNPVGTEFLKSLDESNVNIEIIQP